MSPSEILHLAWDILKRLIGKDAQSNNTKPKQLESGESKSNSEKNRQAMCACLLLGFGGAGKTTLIRRMFGGGRAEPGVKTEVFQLHRFRGEIDNITHELVVTDYRGQSLGQVTSGVANLENSHGIHRHQFNAVVVMLDICATGDSDARPAPGSDVPDYKRLKSNVDQWSGQAIDGVLGIIDKSKIRLAVIFVNKFDVLTHEQGEVHRKKLRQTCLKLEQRLAQEIPFANIEIRLSSAMAEGALDLRDSLLRIARQSVP